ncbi:RNA polymerase sigma factor [Kitasatospora aureofaciens]|uniref:RNA polymerase sigma factor n=1 Tax=Kitasatospora aureofaciens TaxID=1894 RepID=UPI0037F18309
MSNAPTMPATPTPTPRQQFEDIYRTHSRQMTTHIAANLYRTDRHLAEDLTAETFLRLWRAINDGLKIERPRGILNTIASRVIADHFRRRSSHETAADFTAGNHTDIPAGSATTPHLAPLLAELEDAKEHLAQAADAYRLIDRRHKIALAAAANATHPDVIARAQARLGRAALLREAALNDFRTAGEAVTHARAAWDNSANQAVAPNAVLAGTW